MPGGILQTESFVYSAGDTIGGVRDFFRSLIKIEISKS